MEIFLKALARRKVAIVVIIPVTKLSESKALKINRIISPRAIELADKMLDLKLKNNVSPKNSGMKK